MAVPRRFSSPKNAFNGGTPTGTLPALEACPAVKQLCSKIVQGRWRIAFFAPSTSSFPFLVTVVELRRLELELLLFFMVIMVVKLVIWLPSCYLSISICICIFLLVLRILLC
ncbi:hypothetical protein ACFX13_024782 [Malus domestica]